jgi:hypothetical protein
MRLVGSLYGDYCAYVSRGKESLAERVDGYLRKALQTLTVAWAWQGSPGGMLCTRRLGDDQKLDSWISKLILNSRVW